MDKVALKVQKREATGKGAARQLRMNGKFPAVIYGMGESMPITIDRREFTRILKAGLGSNTLLNVSIDGGSDKMAIMRDYQTDPIREEILHVDLFEVAMNKSIHVTVPVVFTEDTPVGVKEGGILQHVTREIDVECLPGNMPEHIMADISALEIGHSVHVSNLVFPEGVTALSEPDTVVASIVAPVSQEKLDEMLSGEGAAEVTEPEVISGGREEEEGEEKGKQES